MHHALGRLARAKQVYDESMTHFRNIGEREGIGNIECNYANVLRDELDMRGAEKKFRAGLALYREVGMQAHEASALGDIAGTLWPQGRFDEARPLFEEALSKLRALGDPSEQIQYLAQEGAMLRDLDDLPGARRLYEEALKDAEALPAPETVARLRVSLALLTVDAGPANEAEPLLRAALVDWQKTGHTDTAWLLAALVEALSAGGKAAEAAPQARAALAQVETSESLALRSEVQLAAAPALAAAADCGRADAELRAVRTVARRNQVLSLELETELAQGQVDLACHRSARAALTALATRATASGFKRIARQAAAR
jgi:tetratricopeptide (TPR) repeat protein